MTNSHAVRPMSYRPSKNQPTGKWARFLQQQRRDRDWSATQAFEAVREGLGLGPKSRASYVAMDDGSRQPRIEEQQFFVKFFGKGPDDEPDAPAPIDPYAVIERHTAALAAQTEAFMALATSIDRAADRVTGRVEDVASVFQDVLEALRSGLPIAADATLDANAHGR